MSNPESEGWKKAKRLGTCVKDNLRVLLEYKFQMLPEKVAAWVVRYGPCWVQANQAKYHRRSDQARRPLRQRV
jgi:hypothetical protein